MHQVFLAVLKMPLPTYCSHPSLIKYIYLSTISPFYYDPAFYCFFRGSVTPFFATTAPYNQWERNTKAVTWRFKPWKKSLNCVPWIKCSLTVEQILKICWNVPFVVISKHGSLQLPYKRTLWLGIFQGFGSDF